MTLPINVWDCVGSPKLEVTFRLTSRMANGDWGSVDFADLRTAVLHKSFASKEAYITRIVTITTEEVIHASALPEVTP